MENIVEESKEVEEGKDVLEIEESMLALPSNKDVAPIRETPPEAGTSKAMEMPEVNARKVVKVEKAMNIPELGARKVEEIAEGGASKAVEIPEGGADNVVEILESVASQAVKIPEGGANNVVEIPEISTGKVVDGVVMIDKKRMDATEIPSTTEAPAPIRSLSPSIAQRMCANQVIGTLAAALKELLENSLDAGATSIHLRLKEYGMDEIEVLDNGHGSHTTSKLVKFEDLDSVSTFGFRGEALHSLCQLCNGICITTMHSSSSTAHQLEYDAIGSLISKKPCLGLVGTKVVLQKIFAVLPVRQKVFVTNHKQEYSKALHLIHAYCLVAENVRVRVSHQASSRKKADILIQTQGGDMFENMILVFGSNIVKDLVQVPSLATQPNEKPGTPKFLVKGYVSSCSHGCGRSAPDKQFFFLNGRPCELPKVQKLVNMVYRQYNKKQYPVVVMNVITQASGNVDFNLDPDKRKVVLKGEGHLT
ncbi:hypothetical protein B566_EDAN008272 [Ephemera danica]|nr:hypothetical protein B566_EDAN008272 [Ephemera danica]